MPDLTRIEPERITSFWHSDDMPGSYEVAGDEAKAAIGRLAGEVRGLREAMKKIASMEPYQHSTTCMQMHAIANAALPAADAKWPTAQLAQPPAGSSPPPPTSSAP